MRHNTKKGRTRFKSKRHGKTRRVQRGGALRHVMDKGNQIGEYEDTTGIGRANYPEVGRYEGHFNENGVPHGEGKITYEEGDVYEGELVDGKRSGKGKMTYKNGNIYEGEWAEDVRHGHGSLTYPSGYEYKGNWLNGKREGHGTQSYRNGDVYDGDWSNNEPHGHGKYTYAADVERSVYVGELSNGKYKGQGTMIYADGTKYEGEWADDHCNGRGILRYPPPDGTIAYEGNWKNNQPNDEKGTYIFRTGNTYKGKIKDSHFEGHGVMTYHDGSIYDGMWDDDYRKGHGVMRYASGDVYDGNWSEDKMSGQGVMRYASGDEYTGIWSNDEPNDEDGTYKFQNGNTYTGKIKDGIFEGRGVMTYASGDVYDGEWVDDKWHVGKVTWLYSDMHGRGVYEGEFKDGLANGRGKCEFINREIYDGMWNANFMNGQGTMTYPGIGVYEGTWSYDQRQGDGKMTYADRRVYEGEWWNDKMHGDGKMTAANGDVIYQGLWRDNRQNPLFDPATGKLADNTEYNATLATRPPKIFPISDNMLYQTDTYKYHDVMELLDRNVLEALEEDPDAIALKVNRTYYVVSISRIESLTNDKNLIQYECPILVDLDVNQRDLERVIKDEPYLSIHGMGIALVGVVPLFDIWSAINSGRRAFELVATRRELLSTATHQVMFKYGSLVSSNHCQSGIPATVYEVQMLRIEDKPINITRKRKQFTIKKNGTKKLNRVINFMRGVQKQSHARTQSHGH